MAPGQTVLIHGATAPALGSHTFLDLGHDPLPAAGTVDLVFDVIGGDVLRRSAALVRAGGTLVTIAAPPPVRPDDGRAVFFVVEPDRAVLTELARRLHTGRLRPLIGAVIPLAEAATAFAGRPRTPGETVIDVAGAPPSGASAPPGGPSPR